MSSAEKCRHPAQDRLEKLRMNLNKKTKDPDEKLQKIQNPVKFKKNSGAKKHQAHAKKKNQQPEKKMSDFHVDQIVKGLVKPSEIKTKKETKRDSKKDLKHGKDSLNCEVPENQKRPNVQKNSSSKPGPDKSEGSSSVPQASPRKQKTDFKNYKIPKKNPKLEKSLKFINEELIKSRNSDKKVKKSQEDEDDSEPMEYEHRSGMTDQIKDARDAVVSIDETMEWDFDNFKQNLPSNSTLNFVVDTNVLLDSLDLIKRMKSSQLKGYNVVIIIPWQVLKELDYLKKKGSTVSKNARIATNYLLDCLKSPDSGIIGQTCEIAKANIPGFDVEVGDDHLIKCCLQLKMENCLVFLLSNDNNLSVKSLVMKISVISSRQLEEILANDKVGVLLPIEQPARSISDPLILKIQTFIALFKDFLSTIIDKYLKEKHGDLWILHSPGNDCILKLIDRIKSFNLFFARGIQENISKLQNFLINHKEFLKITLAESEYLGKCCHYFALSLPTSFHDEILKFESQAAFFKSKKPNVASDSTYSLECCKMTANYIDNFCAQVNAFCFWHSNYTKTPYTPPLPVVNVTQRFNLNQKEFHHSKADLVLSCFQIISCIPVENINVKLDEIKTCYDVLKNYAGENVEPDFSAEDVFEFFIHPQFREFIPRALSVLNIFSSYLR